MSIDIKPPPPIDLLLLFVIVSLIFSDCSVDVDFAFFVSFGLLFSPFKARLPFFSLR